MRRMLSTCLWRLETFHDQHKYGRPSFHVEWDDAVPRVPSTLALDVANEVVDPHSRMSPLLEKNEARERGDGEPQ